MTELSRDSKIHTVAAGVDTQDKGSARTNANREAVTVGDIARVTNGFTAELGSNLTTFSKLLDIFSLGDSGFPRVIGSNGDPTASTNRGLASPLALCPSGVSGDIIDGVASGKVENCNVLVIEGETPILGSTLYSGLSHAIYAKSTSGYVNKVSSLLSVGKIISEGTLKQSFAGFFDVYTCDIFVNLPVSNPVFIDGVAYKQSQRFRALPDTGAVAGHIVKFLPDGGSSDAEFFVGNWDASSDSTDLIAGVICNEPIDTYSTIATNGLINLPTTMIGGAEANGGDIIYADNTTSHLLTTDSASGTKIGIVTNTRYNSASPEDLPDFVRILLKFI